MTEEEHDESRVWLSVGLNNRTQGESLSHYFTILFLEADKWHVLSLNKQFSQNSNSVSITHCITNLHGCLFTWNKIICFKKMDPGIATIIVAFFEMWTEK